MVLSRKVVLVALLIIGVAASCFVAMQRVRVESRNRAVDIVVDYDEIRNLAAATGKTPVEVLREFKKAGATSVAVTEWTFKDAVDNELLVPESNRYYSAPIDQGSVIINYLEAMSGNYSFINSISRYETKRVQFAIDNDMPLEYLEQLPIGLPKDALEAAKAADIEVVARLVNYSGITPQAIDYRLKDVKAKGIKKVIFYGDQVMGFKGAVEDTAEILKNNGLYFGRVEFAKQKGELTLAAKAPGNVIIVHSIAQNEMPALDIPTIVERFQRGARERGVRLAYVRMYDMASADPVKDNAEYIRSIANGIRASNYDVKSSHPLDEVKAPAITRILTGAGVAAGVMLLILAIVNLSATATVLWSTLLIAICAGLAGTGEMGQKVVALLSAITFPTLAAIYAINSVPISPRPTSRPLATAFIRLLGAVAIVAAGGVLIVGLLSARSFMLRTDMFMGVKLAHLLPILILAVLFVGRIAWKSDTWANQKRKFAKALKELGKNPILMWQAAGVAVALGMVAIVVLRSGNDPGVGVSGLELKFRAILDKVLFVRPRTKEFLIGYPALLVGIAFALRGLRQWAAPLIVIGSIGLVSALNTFCHIHTPLYISAWRVINGVIVGSIIGAVAYLLVRNLPGREK